MQKECTTPFEEISPQELNKCLQKFYLSVRKSDGRGRSVITRSLTVFDSKIIIFVLNYKYQRLASSTSVSNCYLVYTAQVDSTFRARLWASSEVIIAKYYSPPSSRWLPVSLRFPKRKFFQ